MSEQGTKTGSPYDKPVEARLEKVEEGEFAGWRIWISDRFETNAGPFYVRRDEEGVIVTAFRVEKKHLNGGGHVHGGCLMTFADSAAFNIARRELGDDRAVTLTMTTEFLGPAVEGQRLECRGEVLRAGGRTIFVRGNVTADGAPCLHFTATLYKVKGKLVKEAV